MATPPWVIASLEHNEQIDLFAPRGTPDSDGYIPIQDIENLFATGLGRTAYSKFKKVTEKKIVTYIEQQNDLTGVRILKMSLIGVMPSVSKLNVHVKSINYEFEVDGVKKIGQIKNQKIWA